MFAVAYKALGDRSLAEEAVQLTFLKTWQAAERLEPDTEIGGWLYTITRRTAIDLYRRESRHTTVSLDAEIVALPTTFEDLWQVWEVRSMIDRLPDGERAVVESLALQAPDDAGDGRRARGSRRYREVADAPGVRPTRQPARAPAGGIGMTCDDFQRSYLEGETTADGEAHLRGCADCQRVTPELDVLRARLGDPAVWEPAGPELRGQVITAVVSAAGSSKVSRRSAALALACRRRRGVGGRCRGRLARPHARSR